MKLNIYFYAESMSNPLMIYANKKRIKRDRTKAVEIRQEL